MQENRRRLLKSVYGICFSILTVLVGILFIIQTWSIFRSAQHGAYTAARISEHFTQISIPVIFWVIALLVNIVLGYVYPDEKERPKPYFETRERIGRLEKRLPKDAEARRWDTSDFINLAIGGVALAFAVAAVIVSLVYLFDKSYAPVLPEKIFTENNGMTDRLLRVLIWSGGATMLLMASVMIGDILGKKKEEKLKQKIAQNALNGVRVTAKTVAEEKQACKVMRFVKSNKFLWIIRGVVGTVGIVFLILGMTNGGMHAVIEKAIKICTQCIGLG